MTEPTRTPRPTKLFIRPITRRAALDAARIMKPVREGRSYVMRFPLGARIEHLIVMVCFVVLAVTGISQSFDTTRPAQAILILLGGLEGTQQIHHFFALILMALAIYHIAKVVDGVLVRLQPAVMLPGAADFAHALQVLTFNLGLTKKLPQYERYTFDEKFVYWVTVIAVIILSLTGLVMWFPSIATQILPGSAYLYAIAIHRWQAIFAVTVMLLLHLYQVLVRKQNASIFNGQMSLAEMKADHPLELAYIEKASTLAEVPSLPKSVKFAVEEMTVSFPERVKPIKTQPRAEEKPAEAAQLEAVENLTATIPPSGDAS